MIGILRKAAQQKDNVWLRARALWMDAILRGPNVPGEDIFAALTDKDDRFRILAHRLLWQYKPIPKGLELTAERDVDDPSPAVRREVLLLTRTMPPAQAKELVYQLAKQYDGKDRFYLEAVGIAVGHHDKARRDVILADFDKEFPEWNDKVADLVWELQPPSVMPSLGKRLADKALTAEQRARIVDILAVDDDPAAGAALLPVLETGAPPEVVLKVMHSLEKFLPNKWRALRDSKELADSIRRLLDKPGSRVAALSLIESAEKTDMAAEVARIAADRKEQGAVRVAAAWTLGDLPSEESAARLKELLSGESQTVAVEAALALGKLAQRKADQPGAAPALAALQTAFAQKDADLGVRQAEASALAGTQPGSAWLLGLEEKKQLPDDVHNDVARLLRNSPYPDLQKKALALFPPPPKLDLKKLPPLAVLAKRVGDAARGKRFWPPAPKTICNASNATRSAAPADRSVPIFR